MEEDLKEVLLKKIWTAEQLLSQTTVLAAKAKELPEEARKSIPVFSGTWSEDGVRKHLETSAIAVRDPLRYKNRKLLEDIGIQTKGLQDELFDDSMSIQGVVQQFTELKKSNDVVASMLIEEGILLGWLREDSGKVQGKLKEITGTRTALQRILDSGIDKNMMSELLRRSIEETGFINSAEDIIAKARFIGQFGICVQYVGEFDEFSSTLGSAYGMITNLQQEYGIENEEIVVAVTGKTLDAACEALKRMVEECSRTESRLLEDWKTYSTTLESIGCTVPEAPHGLHQLEEAIKQLQSECLARLGDEGVRLLSFLKGEGSFPDDISVNSIKDSLEILRPLFVKFLRG